MDRIAVDMDGVLANAYPQFIIEHEAEFGRKIAMSDIIGKAEFEAFPNGHRYCSSSGFFRNLNVIENSQEVLEKLNQKFDIYIVSSATEFPLSLAEKQSWLMEHFPFISWRQLVLCGSKRIVKADVMIDDHFKNLDYFEGKTYLFTQPHNQLAESGRHQRVNSWREIERLLL
ncbi:MAG: 5' nucleotidase, NT5C type [Flammeovirgaceae bacterium]